MNKDDEKIMQLLRDLGEVNEKFVDEADTQVVQNVKTRKISWTSICGVAAAAVIFLTVGISVFRKINDNPVKPAVTDDETSEVSSIETSDITDKITDTEKAEPEHSTENKQDAVSEKNTEAPKETEPAEIYRPYSYTDDIKTAGASAKVKPDGSIKVTFENGRFALTFPASLENHFVIDSGRLISKKAYEKGHDGTVTEFVFESDNKKYVSPGLDRMLGYSGNKYFIGIRNTDYNEMDEDVSEEYDLISDALESIYASSESYSDKKESLMKEFDLPSGFTGEARSSSGGNLCGYTDDYIYGKTSEASADKWPLEEGWHITANKAVSTDKGTWFDCNDTDDNDHYGWINAENVYFYFMDENK